MSVYVDKLNIYPRKLVNPIARKWGTKWCHLFSENEEELHAFAKRLGLKRSYYQKHRVLPHYDLIITKRNLALLYGAEEKSVFEFLKEKRNV
jgi:hypothetical protein